jgi:hypothetical protein
VAQQVSSCESKSETDMFGIGDREIPQPRKVLA